MRKKSLAIVMGCAAIGLAVVMSAGAATNQTTNRASAHAAASKRTGTIAFMRLLPGPTFGARLFVVRPDGSHLRSVTPPNTTVVSYAWSPNGRWIAYVDEQGSLWLIRPDGTGRRLLVPASLDIVGRPSWSPNGRELAVASATKKGWCGGKLYVVPIRGGRPVSLHKITSCDVSWSPRGDEITYDYGGIWVIHPDGTGHRLVTRAGRGGQWSPDGKQLAFSVGLDHHWYHGFAVVDADGRHLHVVTADAYTEYAVAWAPRGRRILYGRAEYQGNSLVREGIYAIGSDGRNDRRVTTDSPPEAGWGALAWSPDGRLIVYATDRTGNGDIYVIGTGGQNKVQLTNTAETDIDPSWAVH